MCEIDWQGKTQGLPPFYVASQFLYPTVCLLSQRAYLMPVLGAIHTANKFILHKPLPECKEYTVGCVAPFLAVFGRSTDGPHARTHPPSHLPRPTHKHTPNHPPTHKQAALKVHEEVELAKKGVNVSFSQVLLDASTKEESWVSRTTVLVPARHKYGKQQQGEDAAAAPKKPTTVVEDARADGCVIKYGGWGGWVDVNGLLA